MNRYAFGIATLVILPLMGCSTAQPTAQDAGPGGSVLKARMEPTRGNKAQGTVTFTPQGESILVTVAFSGLAPGPHGFHIHEKGDCSAPDATSAGGHFNPDGKKHGRPGHGEHHAGDLPMLVADANGDARLTATVSGLSLNGGSVGILGRGLIVHAAPDDFQTQPTGNSGARVACGVIAAR